VSTPSDALPYRSSPGPAGSTTERSGLGPFRVKPHLSGSCQSMSCVARPVSYADKGTAKLPRAGSRYEFDGPVPGLGVSREIPSFRILAMSVVLFKPSFAAAPFRPPTTQLVWRRVAMMCARSASASVRKTQFGVSWLVSSAIGARNSAPLVRITERSIKFWSSRILPGQSYLTSAVITSSGMCSIDFPWRLANVRRK